MTTHLSSTTLTLKEALDYYENGKHRRYTMLFSINGGAFAVAKVLVGHSPQTAIVLGSLSIQQLAIGMMLCTCVVVLDIFAFGERVRTTYLENAFQCQSKVVLFLLGGLLFAGWLLVAGVLHGCA